MTGDKLGIAILILLLLASLAEPRGIKPTKSRGRGADIDNPNVPKVSKLENILESQTIFDHGKVKKPKHLHRFDKPWQIEENNDVHITNFNVRSRVAKHRRLQRPSKKNIHNTGEEVHKRTFGAGITLWPHKTVPYIIESATFDDLNLFLTTLNESIAIFSTESCIEWRVWDESIVSEIGQSKLMKFKSSSGCSSHLGFVNGTITLSQPGCSSVKIFIHEMLHALGMNHEHVRLDRDRHMKINWQNIKEGYRNSFQVHNSYDSDTLDPYSVLQYGLKSFTSNGVNTIEFKDKEYEFLTSLSRTYSFYDFKELNSKYLCSENCQNPPECQNFGYVNQNCVCRCPAGLTGTHCENREGNCGSHINLSSGEVREIVSPGWPNSYSVDLNCVWLINAPANHRIKVKITDMDLAWNVDEQRCYHWIEMHTNLIGDPGLQRCGSLSDMSTAEYFHSANPEAGTLLLKFDSTFANDKTPTTGFRLEVKAFKSGCVSQPCLMGSTCIEGNDDFTFTCSCVPGYSGPLCNQVEADATVTCDMERDFGDHCFLVQEVYGWKIDDTQTQNELTSSANQKVMFARPTTSTSELFSGVTFKDGSRCLAFDYLNNGGDNVGGLTVSYEVNNAITELFSTSTNEGTEWKTIHRNITTTDGFKLVFHGNKKSGRITGIDNVIVAPGVCGQACQFVNPCKNGGVCVPSNDKLDFTCQCSNGYSGNLCETPTGSTIFTCDFEEDMPCFLTQESVLQQTADWTVGGGDTPTYYTGPSNAKSGVVYSYINAAAAQPNDVAVYQNNYLNLPETKRCLMFYYHMRGRDMGTLNVKISDASGLQTILWSKSGDQPDEWFKAMVDVPAAQDLNIYIEGIVGSSEKSDIGIDDVLLRPGICGCASDPCQNGGSCTDHPSLMSYTCSCPSGYSGQNCDSVDDVTQHCDLEVNEDSCFLKQDENDDFQWTRLQGPTGTGGTGPSGAVQGAYYYYMETNYRNYQVARLKTTDIYTSRDRCLKFYYHMYGLKMGRLEVKTNTKSLFLRRGDQGNKWYNVTVPVKAEQDLQLIFEGTVGPGWKSDIAIDGVILEPRPCGCEANPCKNGGTCQSTNVGVSYICHCATGFSGSECNVVGNAELQCTLEDNDGDCFLIQDQTENQNWIKNSGTTTTYYTGPNKAFGDGTYYYYMESSSIPEGDVAMLRTNSTFEDMARCLQVNYCMYGAGLGTLTVKANGVNVFYISGNHQQQWFTQMIEMPNPLHNITIEGIRGSTAKSDIGVDDIKLYPQSCDATKKRQLLLRELKTLEELY